MNKKFLVAALLCATSASAATYEVQDSDYGHKIINLVDYEVQSKLNINGVPYKEGYIVYTESSAGSKHKAACAFTVPLCDKLVADPNKFKLYAGKKAKIETSERTLLDNSTREEVIMEIKVLK